MAEGQRGDRRRADPEKRRQRAERILAAAARLYERWGYEKTTIEDIARAAGVAKGTIYLHWKTREALFMAVLLREWLQLIDDVVADLAADPDGPTLHAIVGHSLAALSRRPLAKALLSRDPQTLGHIVRSQSPQPRSFMQLRMTFLRDLITLLRAEGVVRDDLSTEQVEYLLGAIAIGAITIDQLWIETLPLSDEQQIEMIVEAIKRTLETGRPMSAESRAKVMTFFRESVNFLANEAVSTMSEER